MTEEELKPLIESEISNAVGGEDSSVDSARSLALKYYNGDPRGDEIEGRSKVISTDVADVVEWIMPQITETFFGTDRIVEFDPVDETDQEQAEQETDYVSYVVKKENDDAFLTFSSWFRDALKLKNGYVKVWWEDPTIEQESYEGIDEMQFQELAADPDVEILEYAPVGMDMMGSPTYEVLLERTTDPGCCKYACIPPEKVLINEDHDNVRLHDARFVAHRELIPASELVERGFDRDIIDTIPDHEWPGDSETEFTRYEWEERNGKDTGDFSMREIESYEIYMRFDDNDDGVAELWKIDYAGNKILSKERADSIPYATITTIIQEHKHLGLSIFDRVKMIQDQKTAIWRQLLDNMYLQNNQRTAARTGGVVNFADLLNSRPGGVVRVDKGFQGSLQDAIAPIITPPIGKDGFVMLEYLDKVREERSGVGPDTMGQSMDLSNDTAHGIERLMSAKEMLVGLITRTFAETGVKDLFLLVREQLMKHQDKQKVVQLRGKWVPINPAEWKKRMRTTIRVGLGTGDKSRKQGALMAILNMQEKLMMGGGMGVLIDEHKAFNALDDFVQANGLGDGSAYFVDPGSQEGQQSALAVIQQLQGQMQQAVQQAGQNAQLQTLQRIEQMKTEAKQQETQAKSQIEGLKLQLQQAQNQAKQADEQRKAIQDQIKVAGEMLRQKRELDQKDWELSIKEQDSLMKNAPDIMEMFGLTAMQEGQRNLLDTVNTIIDKMDQPKEIQRDENGNIISVGGRQIVRDESGNIASIN